ncbi:MAG TPA: class F sortase [Jatrophihabitantaceae bacterium]
MDAVVPMVRSCARLAAVAAVAAGCVASGLLGAGTADARPATTSSIRAADFAAGLPSLDMYLTAFAGGTPSVAVRDTGYAAVSRYTQVSPGAYVVSIRRRGSSPGSRPLLSTTMTVRLGKAYTIAAVGAGQALHAVALNDDLTAPTSGFGRVRVIQAAQRASRITVTVGHGTVLASGTAFASGSGYTQLRAGRWKVSARSTARPALTVSATVPIVSGTVTSVVVLDAPRGGLAMGTVLDAAAPGRPPHGGVPTGGGWMASAAHLGSATNWLPALAVLAIGFAIAGARRRATASAPVPGRVVGGFVFVVILVAGIGAAALVAPPWHTPSTAPALTGASATSAPMRLRVPAIDVDTALQSLRLMPDGSLQSPSAWQTAGWYAGGVRPGAVGPAVIAGHVDSTSGPAVFYRLRELRPGDRVVVQQRDGRSLTFVVDGLARYPKADFPAQLVYGPAPVPELRLITCSGDFDVQAHSYLDNLVVSAHLVG